MRIWTKKEKRPINALSKCCNYLDKEGNECHQSPSLEVVLTSFKQKDAVKCEGTVNNFAFWSHTDNLKTNVKYLKWNLYWSLFLMFLS